MSRFYRTNCIFQYENGRCVGKGDGPSCQFVSGQQKGGNYFCWICGISHKRTADYAHAAYRNNFSVIDRVAKI